MTIFWALFALVFVVLIVWVESRRSGRFWGLDNPRRRRFDDGERRRRRR